VFVCSSQRMNVIAVPTRVTAVGWNGRWKSRKWKTDEGVAKAIDRKPQQTRKYWTSKNKAMPENPNPTKPRGEWTSQSRSHTITIQHFHCTYGSFVRVILAPAGYSMGRYWFQFKSLRVPRMTEGCFEAFRGTRLEKYEEKALGG